MTINFSSFKKNPYMIKKREKITKGIQTSTYRAATSVANKHAAVFREK